jgi:transposase
METDPMLQLWHQLPSEPDKLFRLFDYYITKGGSYSQVAKTFTMSKQTVNQIAQDWNWQYRKSQFKDYKREQNIRLEDEIKLLDEEKLQSRLLLHTCRWIS